MNRSIGSWFVMVGISAVALLVLSCMQADSPEPESPSQEESSSRDLRTLSTGKQIRVLEEYEETDEPTFVFKYLTDFEIPREHERLQREVEEIWADLQADAEQRNVNRVYIVPSRPLPDEDELPRDGTPIASGMWFRLSKSPDGSWQKEGGFAFPSPATPAKK